MQVVATMQAGGAISDEVMLQVLLDRVAEPDCDNGFLLETFPRNLQQAEVNFN